MTAPLSKKSEPMSVGSASAPTPTGMLGASALPAATPHRVIVPERQYEGVQFVPIIKAEVMLTLSRIDPVGEVDEVPAFSMG